jgi:hypothetical protein
VVDARQTRLAYDFSNTTLDTLRIGGAGCISTSTVACLSGDFAALVGGSMQVFEFSAFVFGQSTMTEMSSTFGISLDVAGNISSAAQTTSLFSNQHLTVSAALNHGSGNLSFAAAGDVLVNQPIVNNSGSIHLSASRSVQVNAAISAAKSLDISRVEGIPTSSPIVGDATPGIAINANLSANSILISANKLVPVTLFSDSSSSLVSMQAPSPALIRFAPGVTIRALGANEKTSVPDSSPIGPLDNFSVNSGIVVRLGENASFDNQAGAGVFILEGLSSGWIIAQFVPPTGSTQTSLPVSVNLGGLQGTPQSIQQFTSAVCGTDIQCADQVGTSFQGYVFTLFANPQPMPVVDTTTGGGTAGGTSTGGTAPDLVSTAAPVSSVVMVNSDPCVLNPASCSPPQTAVGGALLGVAPLNPAGRLDAPTVSAPLNIAAELTLPRQPGLPTLTSAQAITGGLDAASAAAPGKGGKTQAVADAAQPAGAKASDAKAADAKAVDRKAADGEGAQAKGALVQLVSRLESVATDRRASSAQGAVLRKEAESTSAQARATREEAKQVEVQAKQVEVQARKTDSEARAQREEAQKAEGEVKKAEAQVKSARTPEEKATASRQLSAKREEAAAKQARAQAKEVEAEVKKAEVDIKRSEVEAKRAEADSMQDRAQSKALLADARDLRSAGGKVVAEKRAETKAVESEAKQAVADVKKAEAAAKRVETEVKKAQVEVRQAKAEAEKVAEKAADKAEKVAEKLAQAEKKLADVKAEAQQANERVEQKKADVQTKVETVKRKTDELRAVEGRRSEERKAEMAMMFGMMASARMGKAGMEEAMALRQELKTETFREALDLLDQRPNAVDLPACGGGAVVCIPAGSPALALPPVTQKPTVSFLPQIQRKVAIMIGVNEYSDQNIPSLDTALPDAQAVGEQLQDQFGYVVKTLPNASRADIILNLNKLAREVGPNDSVTVYYAGHGYLNEKTKTGYWIPSDGKAASADKWISNNDISKLLANIPAKQVLLVSDSCYSGSLTKEQLAGTGSISNPAGILARRSVTVLSSGGDEPVSDEGKNGHSVFAYNFMNALKSVDKIDSAGRVFQTVRAEVTKDAPQEPQYGGVLSANHQAGGEFLFEVRSFK